MIRAGASHYVAAASVGIGKKTLFEWLQRGEGRAQERGQARVYVQFARAVRLAQAQARVAAEIMIRKTDPKWWLARMHRDRPGEPGWSNSQRPEPNGQERTPIAFTAVQWRDEMLRMMGEKLKEENQ